MRVAGGDANGALWRDDHRKEERRGGAVAPDDGRSSSAKTASWMARWNAMCTWGEPASSRLSALASVADSDGKTMLSQLLK